VGGYMVDIPLPPKRCVAHIANEGGYPSPRR
jgi:hypothetical protein